MHSTLFALLLIAAPVAAQPDIPKAADPRLVVELVAQSPDIVHPIGLDFDAKGRLLVIESHTHFAPVGYKGPKFDRIRILEKTDGKTAQFSTFFEGTRSTMDIAVHPIDGSVYLATRNEILRLKDTKGTGKADVKERIAFLDTKGDYPHNGLSGLCFDSKGDLYFGMGENMGVSYKLIGSDGVTISGEGDGGHIFWCKANGRTLRKVATGFWNPFGICRDIYGRMFAVDNDPDAMPPCRLLHVVEGGDYGFQFRYGRQGRHPFQAWNGELPGTLPMISGTGEAPCEVLSYESDNLPAEYLGNLLVTSWADHRVERYRLKEKGASFTATREPFVQGGKDFRPVGMAVAPDGSIYISDWVRRDYTLHGKGAIWRIRAKNAPPAERPTDPKLALYSLHRPLREWAARKLVEDQMVRSQETKIQRAIVKGERDGPVPRAAAALLTAVLDAGDSNFGLDLIAESPRKVLVLADKVEQADVLVHTLKAAQFSPHTMNSSAPLAIGDLLQYQAVYLLGLAKPSETLWKSLAEYVGKGGGLAIVPGGEKMDRAAYNQGPAQKILPGTWHQLMRPDQPAGWNLRQDAIFQHPILRPFREYRDNKHIDFIQQPREAKIYWDVRPQAKEMVLVSYADDGKRPALLEWRPQGNRDRLGKVLMFTTALDAREPAWNNYLEPTNSFYPVLISLCTDYLAGDAEAGMGLRVLAMNGLASRGQRPKVYPTEPPLQLAAMRTLNKKTDVPKLSEFLTSADPFLRHAAIRQLSRSPELLERATHEHAAQASDTCLRGVLLAHRASVKPDTAKLLPRFLADPDEEVRFLAAKWIADEKLVAMRPLVAEAIKSPKLNVRMYFAYATALARLDDKQVNETQLADYFFDRLADDGTPPAMRVLALQLVPAKHGRLDIGFLQKLLNQEDRALRLEAVRTLAEHPDGKRFNLLLDVLRNKAFGEETRAQAILGLAEKAQVHVDELLSVAEKAKAPVRDEALRALIGAKLSPAQLKKLDAVQHRETLPLIDRVLSKPFFEKRPPVKDLDAWLKLLDGPADPAAGRRVFAHPKLAGCYRCHRVEGRGNVVGPDLSTIGRTERRSILESILQPSNNVAPHYQTWIIETTDGKVRTGMLTNTDLDDYGYLGENGEKFRVNSRDVVSIRASPNSIMPDGLAERMTDQELRDLLAYLCARR